MSLNLKNESRSKIKTNADIEEVLSGNYSLGNKDGSSDVDLKINKINTTSPPDTSVAKKIQDKIELSSNKDIDIGLDLLVNKEKKADKSSNDQPLKNAYELNSEQTNSTTPNESELSSNVYSQRNTRKSDSNEDTASRIEEMINDLNLDKTSRLSQEDIDQIIDNQDNKRKTPKLASPDDILNQLEGDSQNLVSDTIRKKSRNYDRPELSSGEEESTQKTTDYSTSELPSQMTGQSGMPGYGNQMPQQNQWAMPPQPPVNRELVRKKKQEILFKLEKMRRLGVQGIKHFNMSSDVNEMEEELNRVVHEREVESSVKFQRKCLMAFVTGVELLNNKMDFLDFKLDGWSEQVNDGINEYNEVFEELHEKYKERAKMAPEVKLLFMLGGSAFMYHLSNSMFKNSIPGMEDIMKQNPDLMKQFANAAINQMQSDEERQAASFMFNNSQAARGQPPMTRNMRPPQQMPRAPPQQFQRASPGMPGVVPSQRMPPSSSRAPPQYTRGPEPSISSSSMVNDITSNSEISSMPSRQVEKVKTPFNNSSNKIRPPVGVDEILNELKSNTDSQTDNLSEVLSNGNSRSVSIGGRKKSKKPRRKFNLTVGE